MIQKIASTSGWVYSILLRASRRSRQGLHLEQPEHWLFSCASTIILASLSLTRWIIAPTPAVICLKRCPDMQCSAALILRGSTSSGNGGKR